MPRAFISYARADQAFALQLAQALPAMGIEPWVDRHGIRAGERWSEAIQRALDTCDTLILVLSPASMSSPNVADEWQYALDRGTPVLPVLHEPTDVHFQLGRLQYIDFRGQTFEVALPQLAEGIGQALVASSEEGEEEGVPPSGRAAHAATAVGPPSGTVTFLFTDIEGSTQRWERHPEAMRKALARHDSLMREVITAHLGYVFKTVGDAFYAAFRTAGEALAAALDAQRAIVSEDWSAYGPGFAALAVRMALHTGEVRASDGDYFGPPVNRVARLEAAARGGQVLLSAATHRLVHARLPEGVRLRDLGEHPLRDLRLSEHIFQLVAPGMADVPGRLRAARRPPAGEPSAGHASRVARIDALTPQRLRKALLAIRAGRTIEDEALLELGVLQRLVATRGEGQTPEHRSRALATLLRAVVRERLAELRGEPLDDDAPDRTPDRDAELARLVADFRSERRERACWGLLHIRFLSRCGIRMRELPAVLSVSRTTLARRLKAGLHALAKELRERETRLLAEARPRATPREGGRSVGNLPAPRDRFVGRNEDLARIEALMARSRLVTLIGPGGVGKTRLALEAARRLEASFADGAWVLELAGLEDPQAIEPALAALWQIAEQADEPLTERLARGIAGRRLLLLLDNCEHVVEAVSDVADRLLDRCPELRILATSRVALEVAGEARWHVDPLPAPAAAFGREKAPATEAEQLLLTRLEDRRPGLRPSPADLQAVRRICRRLEGLPLALELAAARAGSIPLLKLAEMIEEQPTRVGGHVRGLPERHRSVRASIDWSYRLLSEREQWLFERLSVFAGGFSLEAVEVVCAGRPAAVGPGIDRFELLDLVSELVEQSLVRPPESNDEGLRYRMLHALRLDAQERLARRGEALRVALALRHARFYHDLALEAGAALEASRQSEWIHRLDPERDNLRLAIQTLREHGHAAQALAMAAALRHYWSIKGALTEGRRLLEQLLLELEDAPGLEPTLRLEALEGAGHLARRQSDYAHARLRLEAALALSRGIEDRAGEARLLRLLGHVADEEARYADAEELYRQALAICRERDDRWGEAALLNNIGLLELNQGHVSRATELLERSLACFREMDERWAVGVVLLNRGNASFDGGDLEPAGRHYAESLAIAESLGDRAGVAAALSALAKLAVRQGEHEKAEEHFRRSLERWRELGDLQKVAEWLEARAVLDRAVGEVARACRLLAAADGLRVVIGAPLLAKALQEHEALLADLRDTMGAAAYTQHWRRGAAMAWQDAVADVIG